jgi:hypothetical protein
MREWYRPIVVVLVVMITATTTKYSNLQRTEQTIKEMKIEKTLKPAYSSISTPDF